MKKELKLTKITLIGVCIILVILWSLRCRFFYAFYMWEIGKDPKYSLAIEETLYPCLPQIVPLSIKTYKNTKLTWSQRNAAALVLIESDVKLAENIFSKYIHNQEDNIVADAIRHLAMVNSTKDFPAVLGYAQSENEDIRQSVAIYLENLNDSESNYMLTKMAENDKSKNVRNSAKESLLQRKMRDKKKDQ